MSDKANMVLCDVGSWILFAMIVADVIGIIFGRIDTGQGIVGFVLLAILVAALSDAEKRYRKKVYGE